MSLNVTGVCRAKFLSMELMISGFSTTESWKHETKWRNLSLSADFNNLNSVAKVLIWHFLQARIAQGIHNKYQWLWLHIVLLSCLALPIYLFTWFVHFYYSNSFPYFNLQMQLLTTSNPVQKNSNMSTSAVHAMPTKDRPLSLVLSQEFQQMTG